MKIEYPKTKKDIITSKMGRETMIYDPKKERLHILNRTASLVWNMANGRHSLEKIARNIRQRFTLSSTTKVESDILQILAKFQQEGLMEKAI